jgi:threonine synthase
VSTPGGLIQVYRHRLPVTDSTPVVTLHEGGTPLLPAPRLAARMDRPVFLKYDGANPTGSFKDRGMTVAVSRALESGAKAVACASTGNTAASAAAYAARAGLVCAVVLPSGAVALGKLAQAIRHGARVVCVAGAFDDALQVVRSFTAGGDAVLVNSLNPDRIAGQQTAAWEIVEALGGAPAVQALPVGNAGNITAYWMGYRALGAAPRMWGFQAAGAAPIVRGAPVTHPETVATAIRIGNPASWAGAVAAREESGGIIKAVTDEQILDAYRLLAEEEGVFAEPASAASVAGVLAYRDRLPAGPVVCTLTGHGLKDPQVALKDMPEPPVIPASAEALREWLGW